MADRARAQAARQSVEEFRAALVDLSGRAGAGTDDDQDVLARALKVLEKDFAVGPKTEVEKIVDRSFFTYRRGAQEFAGYTVSELDQMMERDLSLRDQEILYAFRQKIQAELQRRYPQFDLEAELKRHA